MGPAKSRSTSAIATPSKRKHVNDSDNANTTGLWQRDSPLAKIRANRRHDGAGFIDVRLDDTDWKESPSKRMKPNYIDLSGGGDTLPHASIKPVQKIVRGPRGRSQTSVPLKINFLRLKSTYSSNKSQVLQPLPNSPLPQWSGYTAKHNSTTQEDYT